jgi:hypothetical protein
MKYLIMGAIVGGNAVILWLGIRFGGRWIDKMLCVQNQDPNKPIVRPIACCSYCRAPSDCIDGCVVIRSGIREGK